MSNMAFIDNGLKLEKGLNIIGFHLDVSGQKAIEHELRKQIIELEKQNRQLSEYFINISHEIKTPISIMMLAINLLDQKSVRVYDNDMQKYAAILKQNSYRLMRIVSNLLDIAKIESGYMEPNWEKLELVSHLGELIRSVEFYASQRNISISFVCKEKECYIHTDSYMMERIILNLISNAIKHTPQKGSIVVSCARNQKELTISVRDDGEGIPDDKKAIIFDRFRQAASSLTRLSEGCGIGLALTKSLVELLGGRIYFNSSLGEGTEFIVQFPILVREGEATNFPTQNGTDLRERVQMELSDIEL